MDRETLFEAFKIAIDNEQQAYEFYTDLAKKNTDAELKKLFEEFAAQESMHLRKLKDKYRDMREQDV